jgi:hypothetical protein
MTKNSSAHGQHSLIPLSDAAMLDQFHLDFTQEYAIEDWPVGARPFVMGSW